MNTEYYDRLAQIESGGNPNARNPKSSAKGLFQFTEATAKQYGLEDPEDPILARQAVEKFTQDNAGQLQKVLGRQPTDGELYLAHQQGAGGALKLLTNPDKKAVDIVGQDAVVNNGGSENMTAKEFADKWIGKFGGEERGKKILLPDGGEIQLTGKEDAATITKIKQRILEKYNISIDRRNGAPAAVRSFVGSVRDSEDKLASLQKYYPDAIPYGEDNFVFTNPDTGKLTLYNPKGLDLGDWASVAREGAQVVGGTIGAAGGAAAGTTLAPGPGTVAGGMAGSGVGFAAAGSAFDSLVNYFGLTQDTRTPSEKAIDVGVDVAIGAIGEGVGQAIGAGIKQGGKVIRRAVSKKAKEAVGGGSRSAQNLVNQFRSFGIEPSPSLVTNRGFARLESSLQQNPITAEVMMKQAQSVVDDTQKAVAKIVSEIGEPKTPQGAGETIKQAAINAAERFKFRQEKLYTEAFDLIGSDTPVGVDAVKVLGDELRAQMATAPKSLKSAMSPALKYTDDIVADASNGGIPFNALRQIRTNIGRDLDNPLLTGSTGAQNEAMKRVYGALTQDLANAAKSTSDDAAKKLATADRYTRAWMNTAKDTMNKIAKFDADERAFKFALSASKDGGTSLARLRRNFTPEEWDTIAASVLDKMGDATAGMQGATGDTFSINTFLTNWNRLSPEAKSALFGGPRYKPQREALEQLTKLMERVKDVSRFNNTSNTAGALQVQLLLSGLGGVSGYLASGDIEGAAKGAVAGLGAALTPRMAAKLITNPKFVTWLSEPIEKIGASAAKGFSTSEHIAGLSLLAKEEPEIRAELIEYMKVLQSTTKE